MTRFPQMIFKAHETDPKVTEIRGKLFTIPCINCGVHFSNQVPITFTKLHNGKLIWWHRRMNDDNDPCHVGNLLEKIHDTI